MNNLRNAILSVLFISSLVAVWGVVSMGCDEDVCSDFDLNECWDNYDSCMYNLDVEVSDAGLDLGENCALELCQCLDDEGCDWSAVPQCEE